MVCTNCSRRPHGNTVCVVLVVCVVCIVCFVCVVCVVCVVCFVYVFNFVFGFRFFSIRFYQFAEMKIKEMEKDVGSTENKKEKKKERNMNAD